MYVPICIESRGYTTVTRNSLNVRVYYISRITVYVAHMTSNPFTVSRDKKYNLFNLDTYKTSMRWDRFETLVLKEINADNLIFTAGCWDFCNYLTDIIYFKRDPHIFL